MNELSKEELMDQYLKIAADYGDKMFISSILQQDIQQMAQKMGILKAKLSELGVPALNIQGAQNPPSMKPELVKTDDNVLQKIDPVEAAAGEQLA